MERFLRQPEGAWLFVEVAGLQEAVLLSSVDCRLDLEALYEGVELL